MHVQTCNLKKVIPKKNEQIKLFGRDLGQEQFSSNSKKELNLNDNVITSRMVKATSVHFSANFLILNTNVFNNPRLASFIIFKVTKYRAVIAIINGWLFRWLLKRRKFSLSCRTSGTHHNGRDQAVTSECTQFMPAILQLIMCIN